MDPLKQLCEKHNISFKTLWLILQIEDIELHELNDIEHIENKILNHLGCSDKWLTY